MEKWIANNIGTVITILSLVIGFAMSYAKLRSRIDELDTRVKEVSNELEKLRGAGVPFVCPIHEKRLSVMEQEIMKLRDTLADDINSIKSLVAANHDLIVNLQRNRQHT